MSDSASTSSADAPSSGDDATDEQVPSASRSRMIRDVIVFQIKLGVDGLKDVVLSPLSIAACALDFLRGDGRNRWFHSVMRLGERFERWLNLYGGYKRGSDAGVPEEYSRLDSIVEEAVDWTDRDIPRRGRPVPIRWASEADQKAGGEEASRQEEAFQQEASSWDPAPDAETPEADRDLEDAPEQPEAEKAPAENAPAGETEAEESFPEESFPEEAPPEEAPPEEAPPEEARVEEAAGDEPESDLSPEETAPTPEQSETRRRQGARRSRS